MKVPDNKELCGYEPDKLVTCDIRARRDSNSQGNRDSEISRDSVTTDCASESRDMNILLCPYVIFIFHNISDIVFLLQFAKRSKAFINQALNNC